MKYKLVLGAYPFSYDKTLAILKAKYKDDGLQDMLNDYPQFKQDEFMQEAWDNIIPLTMKDIMTDKCLDRRRELFKFVPLQHIAFKDAEVVDVRDFKTRQKSWDRNGNLIFDGELDNHMELVRIHAKEFFPEIAGRLSREARNNPYIYAVKVICPTTGNTFLLVAASPDMQHPFCKPGKFNALEVVASMSLCPISNPKALYRQGDVLIFTANEDSVPVTPYRLTAREYVELLVNQS